MDILPVAFLCSRDATHTGYLGGSRYQLTLQLPLIQLSSQRHAASAGRRSSSNCTVDHLSKVEDTPIFFSSPNASHSRPQEQGRQTAEAALWSDAADRSKTPRGKLNFVVLFTSLIILLQGLSSSGGDMIHFLGIQATAFIQSRRFGSSERKSRKRFETACDVEFKTIRLLDEDDESYMQRTRERRKVFIYLI